MFVFAFLTICKWRGHLEAHKDKFNPMLVGPGDGTPQLCLILKRLVARRRGEENYNASAEKVNIMSLPAEPKIKQQLGPILKISMKRAKVVENKEFQS